MENVVFDFGNVVVEWRPFRALSHLFSTEEDMEDAFAQIGFYDWNLEQDRGLSRTDGMARIEHIMPDKAHIFKAYVDGLDEAHNAVISGTIEIIEKLQHRGVRLFGLTNATVDAFAAVRRAAPIIDTMEDVVVSAEVGLVKPQPEIYDLLVKRNNLNPRSTLFIDDRLENCHAAESVGMAAHQFKTATALDSALTRLGLL